MQYAGDESYDDYGQYGADGGYDGAMVEPGMASLDNNKGKNILFTHQHPMSVLFIVLTSFQITSC